jgi:hypothetical protein
MKTPNTQAVFSRTPNVHDDDVKITKQKPEMGIDLRVQHHYKRIHASYVYFIFHVIRKSINGSTILM